MEGGFAERAFLFEAAISGINGFMYRLFSKFVTAREAAICLKCVSLEDMSQQRLFLQTSPIRGVIMARNSRYGLEAFLWKVLELIPHREQNSDS